MVSRTQFHTYEYRIFLKNLSAIIYSYKNMCMYGNDMLKCNSPD